jgi:hypothetical protein
MADFKLKAKNIGKLEFRTFEDLETFVNGDLKLKFEGKK